MLPAFVKVQSSDRVTNLIQDRVGSSLDSIQKSPQMSSSVLQALGLQEAAFHLSRPSFFSNTASSVIVKASAANPAYFLINGSILSTTTPLVCDLSGTGLDNGSTLASNSTYYLYAIDIENSPALKASVNPPSAGLTLTPEWTYLGAFVTIGSSTIVGFNSSHGFFQATRNFNPSTITTSATTPTKFTMSPYPGPVVKFHYGQLACTGTSTSNDAQIAGSNITDVALNCRLQASGVTNFAWGFVPAQSGADIYLWASAVNTAFWAPSGWIEDPSEYP